MINLEIDVRSAASVRQVLFKEQENYTYNASYVPQRIIDIRSVISEIDTQIEEELKNETTDS